MRPVHALPANWNHIEEIQEPPSCKASQGFLWHPTAEFDHHLLDIELQKKKNLKEKINENKAKHGSSKFPS